ncbi:MAG: Crp/Fnr family transcriptional regulator [Ruminococcus sp.]|nr:Crp/Fnr family transcriptional regulator [Ruminococcus sp.]
MDKQILSSIYHQKFPFWDSLNEADKEYILNNTAIKTCSKAKTIYDSSDDGGVIIIKNGSLRMYMISEDGKELTLMRIHKDDMCILSASCINESISFDVFIDVEEDVEYYFINNQTFNNINNKYSVARIFALETTIECISDMIWLIQQILFMSMDKRLAIFLLDEISRTNTDTVMLTHSLIAKYMGSAREVVSRMLKYFENEGIVELSRRGVKICDKKRLRELTI